MQIRIQVTVVDEPTYNVITERTLVFSHLTGHRDITAMCYNAGSVVGDMLQMVANELKPEAEQGTPEVTVIE